MNKYFYYGLKDDFNWSDEQFKVVLSDHLEALDILCFLTNTMFEKKIKDLPYKYYSESLAFKYVYQSLNLNSLLNGTRHISEIFNFDTIVFDISSSYIMQRSLFETYLTFYYLYIQPTDENECRCKWLIYQIAGLNSRQDFTSYYIDYKSKIENEKETIKQCIEELKCNEYFLSLPEGKQKDILNRKQAKILGWEKLFTSSDLKSDLFVRSWRLYSNYAHSEYLSLIQFKEYKQDSYELISTKQLVAFSSLILTAVFVVNMKKLYKEIEENFSKLSDEQKDCINFLSNIGKKSS